MENVRHSEYMLKLAVKKKLNFISASKPMFLNSHLFSSIFLGLEFYPLCPGKQKAAQLTVWNKALCQVSALPHVRNAYLFFVFGCQRLFFKSSFIPLLGGIAVNGVVRLKWVLTPKPTSTLGKNASSVNTIVEVDHCSCQVKENATSWLQTE